MRQHRIARMLAAVTVALVAAAVSIAVVPASAAIGNGLGVTQPAFRGTPNSPAVAMRLAVDNTAALVASRPSYLHASADDKSVQLSVISSAGVHYVPFERTYRDIKVVGGDFVLVTNNAGQVIFNSVAQDRAIGSLSTAPRLNQVEAEAIAKGQLRTVNQVEGTALVVYALGAKPRLAWESTITGTSSQGYSRLSVDVDALTGNVLRTRELVMRGTGTSAYNGWNPVTINTTQNGGTFSMLTPNFGDMPCQDAANNTTFTGPDDAWGNGNATSRETGCVDALFAAQTQIRMLGQWLGRSGMNGTGGAWPIRVGLDDINAFYDGTQVQIGHNTANQWISSLDVVAHEMGHGIDDKTPGGISANGTQEFIADVFGAATEGFANEPAGFDVPDYLVGEKINLLGTGPIRNMYHPSLINNDPNCYSSSVPSLPVHKAAGPGNHWFYLLAEGTNPTNGQPTSPTCNGTTLVGVGLQNATRILYNAMLMKTSASSYLRYRTWTLQAAKNLDATCALFNKTKAAWDAVSVPAQTADPTCTPANDFVVVNSASFESGTVASGSFLTIYTASRVTDEELSFPHPWVSDTPDGMYVQTNNCQPTGTVKLKILYVGPAFGGNQINLYYPNDYQGGSNVEPFTCAGTGSSVFTVHPKPNFGANISRAVTINNVRPGMFMDGSGPAGYHLNAITSATTAFSTCNADTTNTLCPVSTNGVQNFLIVFTTGAEKFGCPDPSISCTPPNSGLAFLLAPVGGGYVQQEVTFFGFAGFLGQEQANIRIQPGTTSGEKRLQFSVPPPLIGSNQQLVVRLGAANQV